MDTRTAYETFLRKRVSDSHWSSVKRTLTDSGMEITPDTVVFFAKLRKEIPKASVGILQVFECYQQADREFRSVPSLVLAIVKKTLQEWNKSQP